MSDLYKIKEGKVLIGVCAGLEASGKGNAIFWRLGAIIVPGGWIAYIILALTMKSADSVDMVKEISGTEEKKLLGGSVDKIEVELKKIAEMKEKGLLNDEEYETLRKKTLGL
tara:strand:+ start:92 stop:427 length:336 start_codon:yes stop_codon:yes gene_type:complete